MPEIAVAALEPRLQKQVESARAAFTGGRYDHAVETAAAVLQEQPACLSVRKLLRAAQLKQAPAQGTLGRLLSTVSSAPFVLGGSHQLKGQPLAAVASADKILRRDANSGPALTLLGEAALALGWSETAVFAYEAALELEPGRPALLLALGQALLAVGRAADAVKAAHQVLAVQPNNADAQGLLRNASVAVTMARGKWAQGGDYRGKLHDGQKTAQLEQAARLTPKAPPPQA